MFFLLGTFACCTSACAHWVSCRVVSWIHRWLMFWPLCSASPGGDVSLPPPATAPKDVLKAENCASSVATTGGFDGPLWALLSHTSCMWSWIPDLPTKPLAFHWVDGGGPASLLALCLNSAASSEYFIFISSAELQKLQCQNCPRSIWSPSIFPRHFMLFFFLLMSSIWMDSSVTAACWGRCDGNTSELSMVPQQQWRESKFRVQRRWRQPFRLQRISVILLEVKHKKNKTQ